MTAFAFADLRLRYRSGNHPLRRAFPRLTFVAVAAALLCAPLRAAEPPGPFVAGFDRFARHAEISPVAGGRLLISELSCTACHHTDDKLLEPKRGPRLNGVGNRLTATWIRRFLAAPHSVHPGTTMPDLLFGLTDAEREHAASALAAFLSSQHEPYPEVKASGLTPVPYEFWNHGNGDRGRGLYHHVGCVACHDADPSYETVETKPSPVDQLLDQLDPEELEELGLKSAARSVSSVPQGELPEKYTRQSLTFFLLDPGRTRPSGRMPHLKLAPVEAADIAAYLLREQNLPAIKEPPINDRELIPAGRQLFVDLRCVNCHTASGLPSNSVPAMAKPLAEVSSIETKSCLKPTNGLPHFQLDELQSASLQAALRQLGKTAETSAADTVTFRMLQFNCYACHERDDRGGVGRNRRPYFETAGHIDIGDEGRLPPPLTGVGSKLTTAWLQKVLQGSGDVRLHMRARMPRFPTSMTAALPELLARTDIDARPLSEQEVFGDVRNLAEAGRLLLDTGCVQCHPLRGEALPGVAGIDLNGIANRVHPQWFRDFLLNPAQLKPRTRMPTFFPNGRSQNAALLEGNVDRQIAAMWSYLKQGNGVPLPDKLLQARNQNFELIPKEHPIVLRTFMDTAGTHAIAVGFPEQVHFAFDAEHIRLAQAWRGRFLDAQGTWFDRFAPPAKPLGEAVVELPSGVPFALLSDSHQAWPSSAEEIGYRFAGYRLDKKRVPTFLYRMNHFEIEDRITPDHKRGLQRRLKVTLRKPDATAPKIWFRPLSGKVLTERATMSRANERGLAVTVSDAVGRLGKLRHIDGVAEWLIPLEIQDSAIIEVRYQWSHD